MAGRLAPASEVAGGHRERPPQLANNITGSTIQPQTTRTGNGKHSTKNAHENHPGPKKSPNMGWYRRQQHKRPSKTLANKIRTI
jgi:hypothetical protein